MTTSCDAFYDVQAGDGCWQISQDFTINLNDFYSWNPAVGTSCSGLDSGYYVCVGILPPQPVQAGINSACENFYFVQPGDGCYDIANDNGITLANFYAWNPAVHTDCSGLDYGYYVCIYVGL
jgi:LysM repeat protein